MDWTSLLTGGAGGVLGFCAAVVTGLFQRPKVKADAAAELTEAAVKQINELQEQVASARAEVREARSEAREARLETEVARQQVRQLAAEVDECMQTLRAWRAAIFSPQATVEGLRAMVGPEPGANGR